MKKVSIAQIVKLTAPPTTLFLNLAKIVIAPENLNKKRSRITINTDAFSHFNKFFNNQSEVALIDIRRFNKKQH